MSRPTYWHEVRTLFGILLKMLLGLGVLVVLVFYVADAANHPIRAAIVLYTLVVVGAGLYVAHEVYRQKRKAWENEQQLERATRR